MSKKQSLPTKWSKVSLTEITELIRGVTYKKSDSADTQASGLVPILRATNIQDNQLLLESALVYVPASNVSEKQILHSGDVVVCLSSGSKHLVGKTAISHFDWQGSFGAFCGVIRSDTGVSSSYVGYYLQSPEYKSFISSKASGVNINNLRRSDFDELIIPVAAKNEQDRIVIKIDELFSQINEGNRSLKKVEANLKRYRASILKDACEGKLVPTEAELAKKEGRGYEHAGLLLERILKERKVTWEKESPGKKYKEPKVPDTSNLSELPEGWVWTSMGQVFNVHVGSTPSRAVENYWGGDIPWVSSGAVSFCRIKDTKEKITKLGFENSSTTIHPTGTILVGMIGEGKTRGQVAILDIKATHNQNSAAIRVSDTEVIPEYIYYYLFGKYEETRRTSSGNNQPALNRTRVMEINFPLPPIKEQIRIVEEIEKQETNIVKGFDMLKYYFISQNILKQSILKKAFAGKLVPQNPDDEPASTLLKKIKEERAKRELEAKVEKKKKPTKKIKKKTS